MLYLFYFRKTSVNSEEIDAKFILHIIRIAVKNAGISAGDEEIRMHTIRATGNFLQLVTNDMIMEDEALIAVEEAVNALITYASNAKHMKASYFYLPFG